MRVYELANQLGVSSRDLLLCLEELGVGGKTASSTVPPIYLGQIRARFQDGGEAPQAATSTEAAPAREKRLSTEPKQKAPAEKPSAPAKDAEAAPAEEDEGDSGAVRLKAPFTANEFATALDTDGENIVRAAGELGEDIAEGQIIPSELAILIGEQWGYTVEIEEPKVVEGDLEQPEEGLSEEDEEEPELPEPPHTQDSVAAAVATPADEPEKKEPEAPAIKVVPRRTAPPDAPARPPVVTVLGHVDHGKTTLLDAIRQTNVTGQEPGEITQHVGAYQVDVNSKKITFIDTPGHEAFTAMRARGAQVTDIAVLVVAADDGVMPQTLEAVDHAQAAGVPIVVAVNKMDRPAANLDAVKQRLTETGLVPEEWGGDTIYVPISALEKTGIDDLLEMILLVAEVRDIRAAIDKPAEGVVLEAELDRRRGSVATLLVQEGVLKQGDSLVAGPVAGKVRAMMDDRGERLQQAGPSIPVLVLGLSDVPEASELFEVVENDKKARAIAGERQERELAAQRETVTPISLADLSQLIAAGETKVLNLILKADAQGTVEAIAGALAPIGNEEISLNILHSGVGDVNESDVSLAAATKPTVIVGFQVNADSQARRLAADEDIEIRRYEVIYDLIDDVRDTMSGMLETKTEEVVVGQAEVRALFQSSRLGTIAGCYVTEGRVVRGTVARVRRRDTVVHEGRISSLRHVKDDAAEIAQGFECGIVLGDFNDLEVGDVIESVEERELRRAVL
jgi:translation initiation factor IF-2